MNRIILLLILFAATAGKPVADETGSTDAERCAGLLSGAVTGVLAGRNIPVNTSIRLLSTSGHRLTSTAGEALEAALTRHGYRIADSNDSADMTVDYAVSHAAVILKKEKDGFERTVRLTVHVQCFDPGGLMLFAAGEKLSDRDFVPAGSAKATDNIRLFGRNLKRTVVGPGRTVLMAGTFILFISLLAYFANR